MVDVVDYATREVIKTKIVPKISHTIPMINTNAMRSRTLHRRCNVRTIREINPEFDTKKIYIPRSRRSEWHCLRQREHVSAWHAIGLLGKCKVLKDQPVNNNWVFMGDNDTDSEYNWYLIR